MNIVSLSVSQLQLYKNLNSLSMHLVVIIYLTPGSEYSMAREMEGDILSMRRPNNHLKYLMLNICGFAAEVRCSEATQRYLQLKMSSTRNQLAREPHQPTDRSAASNIHTYLF